ncbi:MAG TPA: 50S ribosomal protein L10, partial [Polyangiaceae bacterium]
FKDKLDDVLAGMTGVAWSYEDPSAAAKVVKSFRKDGGPEAEKLTVKAALLDGAVLDAKAVEGTLASMPGKNELRATLLSTLQAPLQQFVALLQAPAQNLVYVLSAKERKGA